MLFKRTLLNQKGQTAIEYVLLVAVAITIGATLYTKVNEFMIKNPNSIFSKELRRLQSAFAEDSTGRYQRFNLRK